MRTSIDLYRHYAASGELLYVGISYCALNRSQTHLRASHWAHEIARIEIAKYPTRSAAMEAESAAILAEKPKYNIQHTPAGKKGYRPPVPRSIVGLAEAITKAGNQSKLAELLGLQSQHVANWMNRDKRIPVARVLDVERVTGVHRSQLRPDIYPAAA